MLMKFMKDETKTNCFLICSHISSKGFVNPSMLKFFKEFKASSPGKISTLEGYHLIKNHYNLAVSFLNSCC